MIKLRSLNNRLLIAFSVLTTIVCLFFIQLSVLLVEQTKENTLHQMLVAEGVRLEQAFAKSGKIDTQDDATIKVFQSEATLTSLMPSELNSLAIYSGALIHADSYLILKHQLAPSVPIWLVLDTQTLGGVTTVTDYMMLFLYSIAAGVMMLTLLSSWYLAKLLSLPIRNLTFGVLEKPRSPDIALYGHERSDEIGTLSRAFDDAFSELDKALKREQNFTRDVSHELRTPITLIKNTLSLYKAKPMGKDQTDILQQASTELEQTVEVLLALARQENLMFERFPILPIVEKSILAIYNSFPQLVFDVNIDIEDTFEVVGNPYLISLLCQNLVNNGFYHGAGGKMTISSLGDSIVFENSITHDEERPTYQGLGHGQYLVTRIAEEMNWHIEVEQKSALYRVSISRLSGNS